MAWPDDDSVVDADLQGLVDSVRAGSWLRTPLSKDIVVGFIAGFVVARPGSSLHEIGSALRLTGLGPYWRRRLQSGAH